MRSVLFYPFFPAPPPSTPIPQAAGSARMQSCFSENVRCHPQGPLNLPSLPHLPHKPQLVFQKAGQFHLTPVSPSPTTRSTRLHPRHTCTRFSRASGTGWPPASPDHLPTRRPRRRGTAVAANNGPKPQGCSCCPHGAWGWDERGGFAPHASRL